MEAMETAQAVPQVPEKLSNTDSLAVVLSQALQAGDKALLDKCLGVSNERVIRNTVSQLQSSQAVVLARGCHPAPAVQPAERQGSVGMAAGCAPGTYSFHHGIIRWECWPFSAFSTHTCQPECMNTLSSSASAAAS